MKKSTKTYLMVSGTIAPAIAAVMIGKAITKQSVLPMKPQCWFVFGIAAVLGGVITYRALKDVQTV